jgi:hypothetical protein
LEDQDPTFSIAVYPCTITLKTVIPWRGSLTRSTFSPIRVFAHEQTSYAMDSSPSHPAIHPSRSVD